MSDESQLAHDMMQPWQALPKRPNPILQLVQMDPESQVRQFLGHLSQDPELRYLPGGQSVQELADTEQATQFLLQARHDEDER